ncbi:hypothetical protein [Brevibacterium casei]|uniref:hypothetical protein n=1 Tax=Brevibacterium casei TaxID=33889 RepID=UPI003EBE74DD
MSTDYVALKKFVHDRMVAPELEINQLDTTRDAIASIIRQFTDLGWRIVKIEDEKSRHRRHELTSPDGRIALSMIGGKVYRHPSSTEQICRRKHLTKKMLDIALLPTPIGADFTANEKAIAAAFFEKMPKPVVVKPTDSGSSHGVTVGVTDQAGLSSAWQYALDEGRGRSNVLIEQFVRGVELRAFVVGSSVVSVFARIQPFVVGSGQHSLESLIEKLHVARSVHYRANKMPVVVDWEFLERSGYVGSSVPNDGDIVFLNPFNFPSMGSFLVDVTKDVSAEIRNLALRAKDSIPFLEIAGVDLLVEDLDDVNTASILEVNTAASLDLHRYPTHGEPRAVDQDIVDYFHQVYLDTK